ncbi:manganese transport protein [Sphingomonas sp. BE270]|jgi:manganese transport protein|uniref:Nramp family divalent metal transporter n=1 Tax=unclassified Sphingomonas TaxID=196159 RepID=UPI00068FC313|nr:MULTISPECIES: Nramp family divalent metal transporter [unclassified Sphingomonas]MDR6849612.1 manganese transport protein [Sphingomonas sp. BE137]MDR7258767.1 manganese transport protein [Sphingomonas sp. BE270]
MPPLPDRPSSNGTLRPPGTHHFLPSLPEAHRTLKVWETGDVRRPRWRQWLGFAGPGFMVSVGYMDPGNWGTDLAGGSQFGYALLWVILASNLMAIFLQVLCARLGIVTGRDLAQSCRDYYPRPVVIGLWLLCEIAIIACDLAEVVGSAVALNLLLGLPLIWGVLVTGLDVLLLLLLINLGFRKIEAVVLALVTTIALCFAYTIFLAKPDWTAVALGAVTPSIPNQAALVIALGILGATVMPHNLYLHSAIVQTRAFGKSARDIRAALAFNTLDTVLALGAAFFVNAAILVLAAAVFWRSGVVVTELQDAHQLLRPALGGAAATAFAVALLASGQSSTITGTLAGQIVMEGFLHIRVRPWIRRLVTRGLAIVPAVVVISATGGRDTVELLVVSQVVLSMQLPFAIFPLMMVTSSHERMGAHANGVWVKALGYAICTVIAVLNVYLLWATIGAVWLGALAAAGVAFALWVHLRWRVVPSHSNR